MSKNVLIVTYYWPPAGGPGVQRWLKFVKYLPNYGFKPIVFVPENPSYPIVDESLRQEVDNDTEVIKYPIKEPYKLAKFLSKKNTNTISKGLIRDKRKQSFVEQILLYLRGNFFIPDARVGWVKPATHFLMSYISEKDITTVITTGPPHSLHLIGLNLKTKLNIKWIADFRDPWTTIGYHKQLKLTKSSQEKHKKLESEVLNTADNVIVTSEVTKKEFSKITNKPVAVVTNGYDDEPKMDYELDSKFTLSHIGSFLSKRNPQLLWQVLSELINELPDFKTNFQLNLVGNTSNEIFQSLDNYNLTDYVRNVGYVSHKESIKFQKQSQLLLLVEIDSNETKCIIPGKLFEYMVSNRPIIALGPKESDVERIVKETNTGFYFTYNDAKTLKSKIWDCYKLYKSNTLRTYPIGLKKYHRKTLTKSLSQLL